MRTTTLLLLLIITTFAARAHVSITYPTGGESFMTGQQITIQWALVQDHGDASWELYYSADDGATWSEIKVGIDKSVLEYQWTLPIAPAAKARIRVVQNNVNDTNYESISKAFQVSTTEPVVTNLEEDAPLPKEMQFSVFPDQASSACFVRCHLAKPGPVAIAVFDLSGNIIAQLANNLYSSGEHEFTLQLPGRQRAVYIARANINGHKISKKIVLNP